LISKEFYFLSLLFKYKFNFIAEFNPDIFQDNDLKILFQFLVEALNKNIAEEQLAEDLEEDIKQTYYAIKLFDLSFIKDPKLEVQNTYKFLYKEYLKRTISQLSIYDDEETVIKINELVKELKLFD